MEISVSEKSFKMFPATFKVYIALQKYADKNGVVKISYNELTRVSYCAMLTVVRAIKKLEQTGFLTKKRCVGKRNQTNTYHLVFPSPDL